MKRVWNILFWIALATGAALLPAFEYVSENRETLADIEVELIQAPDQLFLSREDILQLIEKQQGIKLGMPLGAINTHLLEESIDNHPFINHTEIFSTLDGKLHARVKQKTAIARVIATPHVYLDEVGNGFPTSKNYSARVPYITGKTDSANIYQAVQLIGLLMNDEFYKPWLAEVHITPENKIELVPTQGNHRIKFGTLADVEKKLTHLKAFYNNCVTEQNLQSWKTLDISYHNLLVSTKHN